MSETEIDLRIRVRVLECQMHGLWLAMRQFAQYDDRLTNFMSTWDRLTKEKASK